MANLLNALICSVKRVFQAGLLENVRKAPFIYQLYFRNIPSHANRP